MNRRLYYTPSWMDAPRQLGIFDYPRELTRFSIHHRINYRYNVMIKGLWYDDHLLPYEQYVKAIRFGYSQGFMEQFTFSPYWKTALKLQYDYYNQPEQHRDRLIRIRDN